ncbi:RDD family protein [Streptomyces smyrnaeus]
MGPSGTHGEAPRAGYYPDPSIPGYIRYWNGSSWVPGTSRPEPREGEPMPAPPPVASSPATAPSPPATADQEGPAGPPSPRRSASDETGPVFLDTDGDGDERPAPGVQPSVPGPQPAASPRGGFGPPAADPRGDWGSEGRASGRAERRTAAASGASGPEPAPELPGQGGREKTVGLRRSEVLRTGDRPPRTGVPSQAQSPAPDSGPERSTPAGSAARQEQAPASGAAGGGGQGERPEQGPGSTQQARPVPEQSAGGPRPEAAGGAATPARQVPGQASGQAPGGGSNPSVGVAPEGQGGPSAAPAPGGAAGAGQLVPRQASPGPEAARPAPGPDRPAQAAIDAGPAGLPAQQLPAQQGQQGQQGPPAGLAPVAGPVAGPAPQQGGGPQASAVPSWSQPAGPAGLPAQPQTGGPDAVTPWRPPVDDPFARAARQEARPGALGKRLGARLVDLVLTLGVAAGAAYPFVGRTVDHIDAKIEAVEQAGVTQRVWLIDGTTGGYLAVVVGVLLLFGLLYEVVPTARWGRTLGKKLFGLSVLNIEGYQKPTFGRAVARWLVHGVLGLLVVGLVNAAWCLFDRPWRQCWHDKVAGTFVAKGSAGDGELRL